MQDHIKLLKQVKSLNRGFARLQASQGVAAHAKQERQLFGENIAQIEMILKNNAMGHGIAIDQLESKL